MKLVGGEFALNSEKEYFSRTATRNVFPEKMNNFSLNYYQSGVDAIAAIISEINNGTKIKSIFFPTHYCEETIELIKLKTRKINYSIKRYSKTGDLNLSTDEDIVVLFYLNYFDITMQSAIAKIAEAKGFKIIEDFVQCPLDIVKAISYSFNSLRKFCSIDISVAYLVRSKNKVQKKESKYLSLRQKAKDVKNIYFKSGNSALEQIYLDLFAKAEKRLNVTSIQPGNTGEQKKITTVDFGKIRKRRTSNHSWFGIALAHVKQIKPLKGEYMYFMIQSKKRDELRKYLNSRKIFCPVHWPDSSDEKMRKTSLSLPIDHRINKSDIKKIASAIKEFYAHESAGF